MGTSNPRPSADLNEILLAGPLAPSISSGLKNALRASRGTPMAELPDDHGLSIRLRDIAIANDCSALIHMDQPAREAAAYLGVSAFTVGQHIYLGGNLTNAAAPAFDRVLAHELVHVAQVRRALSTGGVDTELFVEQDNR